MQGKIREYKNIPPEKLYKAIAHQARISGIWWGGLISASTSIVISLFFIANLYFIILVLVSTIMIVCFFALQEGKGIAQALKGAGVNFLDFYDWYKDKANEEKER